MRSNNLKRREFITLLGGAAAMWPLAARAQQPKIPKVGFLYPGPSTAAAARIDAFLGGLRTAGYRVPEQVEFISRFADGDPARLAPRANELIDQNVDVIAAVSTGAANAVRAATASIPIVALDLETDPVATGIIASLAHPGGSITGFFFDFPEFRMKLLELLKEAVPSLSKIAIIWDPNSGPAQLKSVESAAEGMKLKIEKLEVRNAAEMSQAFEAAKLADVDAVMILSSPFIGANAKLAADLTLRHGLPAVTLFSEFARNGGLMSYGPNIFRCYTPLRTHRRGLQAAGRPGARLTRGMPARKAETIPPVTMGHIRSHGCRIRSLRFTERQSRTLPGFLSATTAAIIAQTALPNAVLRVAWTEAPANI